MSGLNLRNIDLNLLVAFEALMIERHVSRAASRIGVSQPAMSRSLKQLRETFGDPLFQRTSEGMIPTPRAAELARLIRPGLETIAQAIGEKSGFDPSVAHRRFQMSMTDMATYLALPAFLPTLRKAAPYIDIAVANSGNRETLAKVESGQVEFGFGTFDYLPPGVRSHNLSSLREICVADPANPILARSGLDLDAFLSLPHVAVAMNGDRGIPIDVVLETLGYKRRVVLTVPTFLPVPRLLVGTDMIAVVVEDLLDRLPESQQLVRYKVPFALDPVMGRLIWHRRFDEDPGHIWFREMVARVFGSPES